MIEVELPNGTILEFPQGTSDDIIQRVARQQMGAQQPEGSRLTQAVRATRQAIGDAASGVPQQIGNVAAGAIRGAGSIGATILAPIDAAARAAGIENSWIGRTDRRESMTEGLRSIGAQPESLGFMAGKIGSEIAGTAGVGGVLGRAAGAVGAPSVLRQTLASGGMSSGGATGARGLGARMAGGAAAGGTSAAIVNPEEAGTGAAIGAMLPAALSGGRMLGSGLMNTLGVLTGTGREAVKTAFEAGQSGGARGKAFVGQLRRQDDMLNVLDDARANVAQLRADRSAQYKANIAPVSADKTVLDIVPIQDAVRKARQSFTFAGQPKNPAVVAALGQVDEAVSNWQKLNPAQYHTPEGLDALKQQIGAILESLPQEARAPRTAVSNVYNSVKRSIETQAPAYSKAMRDYQEASDLIDEVTRSLSLKDTATADTAMRKLQSVMRNNVNTNYGARTQLIEQLEQQGGRELMPALAGQALSDWFPRGLQRATGPAGAIGLSFVNPVAGVASAAMSSPRLMGEAMYGAGQASRYIDPLRRGSAYIAPVLGAQ